MRLKTRMEFKQFDFRYFKNTVHLLPTIRLDFDNVIYRDKNFAIEIHFLFWHWRWLWLKTNEIMFIDEFVGENIMKPKNYGMLKNKSKKKRKKRIKGV